MFLEFCLSSFGFLNFERGIICSQTLPPCYLSKIFQNLTTYSSQTCFIFHSQKQYCSCQDAVSFPNEVFNQGPSGGLCYSNVSKMMLVLKNTTRQFTSNGLVSLGPHPWVRPGVGAPRQAPGGQVFTHGTQLGVSQPKLANYQQLVARVKSGCPCSHCCPCNQATVSGRIWMNTCIDFIFIFMCLQQHIMNSSQTSEASVVCQHKLTSVLNASPDTQNPEAMAISRD